MLLILASSTLTCEQPRGPKPAQNRHESITDLYSPSDQIWQALGPAGKKT